MESFILKGDIVYNQTPTELRTIADGFLVCENGICRGAFENLPKIYDNLPLEDYSGMLIFPGMVDLHLHAPQFAYRGLGMDLELLDWLNQNAFPEEGKFSDLDYARKAYGIFADCMKNSATTRAVMFATTHRPATKLLMDLMEESGLITYVGKVNMDYDAPDYLRESNAAFSAAETRHWLDEVKNKYQHTHPILTPRFLPSCTHELMEELSKIQKDYDLPVQSHLSENPKEIEFVAELYPETAFYGDGYAKYSLIGDGVRTIMAHCVYSSDPEIELMKRYGVYIAHCPASNTYISSGLAPIRKYLNAGLKVGLGTDIAGGCSESIFRAISDAIGVSKMAWRHIDQAHKALTFPEALWLATRGGGEFFGNVGGFDDGFEFDAVVLDDSILPHPQDLDVLKRAERAVYLQADMKGIRAKFAAGHRVL